MREVRVGSFAELARALADEVKLVERRVETGRKRAAANEALGILPNYAPRAFGELAESFEARHGSKTSEVGSTAPHFLPVELGSRPHTPPLAPLIAWVKLRGAQALSPHTKTARDPAARSIGRWFTRLSSGSGSNSVDDPVKIARAIQHAISVRGTKPHHFVAKAWREILRDLDAQMQRAIHEG